MGLLRVFLAVAVVVAHSSPIHGIPLLSGRTAVECFFAISGFYMAMVLEQKYLRLPVRRWLTFMWARVTRLFPVYWIVLALSAAFVALGGSIYLGSQPQLVDHLFSLNPASATAIIVSTVALFSQDWSLFAAIDQHGLLYFTSDFWSQQTPSYLFFLVPQAWSIGLELTFYVLAPFILRLRTRSIVGLLLASVALRCVGLAVGLSADPWTYRFFPFEISLFLAGVVAYRERARLERLGARFRYAPLVGVLVVLGALPLAERIPDIDSAILIVVPFVVAAALPAIFASTKRSKVDRWIGELSYPLYLVHVLVISVLVELGVGGAGNPAPGIVAVPAAVVVAVALVQLVDRPLESARQRRIARSMRIAGIVGAAPASGSPARSSTVPDDPGRVTPAPRRAVTEA